MKYDRAQLHAWNLATHRSRRDYQREPNRACWAMDYDSGPPQPCSRLHDDDSVFCARHKSVNSQAARRMRALRARRAAS